MTDPRNMIELWRGDLRESWHCGHAVVCDERGEVVAAWGDPDATIYPRSSCKMMQALPMVEAGIRLPTERLALACASHQGAPVHVEKVRAWLADLGLGDDDLLCGTEVSRDKDLKLRMIREGESPCQVHNNCSGKHAGFLTFAQHLNAGPDYVDPDHPVQRAVRDAHEDLTGMDSPGFGIDGCSAPNFATSVHGLARAMACFAAAREGQGARGDAMARLRDAMCLHPDLVAGETRACTDLMRAMGGRVAVKTGAEAVFVAMLPEQRLGVALKVVDGATRASEAAITALLVHLGVLDATHPAARRYLDAPILNRAGLEVGRVRAAEGFPI
ncbi:asparaginase [Palleronia sp. LCG004]|uniref:asparaginase n=1 Tax=Palleronia sp. LCG004 TaxID=3079304 RepID=UPI002941BF93|nr:asparaginase [Palleronia sp. LCG004]WOI55567.1 asparaginase [Palleronia sp. LCG004]